MLIVNACITKTLSTLQFLRTRFPPVQPIYVNALARCRYALVTAVNWRYIWYVTSHLLNLYSFAFVAV